MEESLYPTHTCFDDALDYLALVGKERGRHGIRGHFVVHGICLVPDKESFVGSQNPGDPFAHAWVEHEGRVIQGGIFRGERVWFSITVEEFHEKWRVRESTRYSVREALRLNRLTNHYGPWLEKYEALTRTAERVRQSVGGG